ncbi:conserved hypothetical protein [Burkholderia pseudomallei MSHR346]|nr:hypothetical protein BURPS1655_D0918 [Burkholderia pseudomallei 1655]EEP52081.1 conserved hypothetical protein [Burkholderia pseudomallei MSHR346]
MLRAVTHGCTSRRITTSRTQIGESGSTPSSDASAAQAAAWR